jgi:MFS family permease
VGLVGSSAFAGWTAACLIIPRLGDIYGRKWPVSISLLIATITHILIVVSTDWNMTVFLFFIFGGCCAGRYSTAFVYLSELMPPD